ncbi:hypothetical protein ACFQVD_26655 [Streptosporangium amethystogenes subsp. fukuiense]|uniref:Uncharacterized protein n=1 Tax=Streptosporangium amethystogenes subsp. fukuiense TaxID=698418 RepID=A0ABW2T4T7_9ACTN
MNTAATRTVPAEHTRPDVGPQIVNVYRDGVFVRQLRHRGTVEQARAAAALQTMHDTHPEFTATVARLRGE